MKLTPKLGLHRQEFGDNPETWGDLEQEDKMVIDEVLGDLKEEIERSRGNTQHLNDRLNGSMYNDGTPRSSMEIIQARGPFASLRDSMARRGSDWVPNALNIAPDTERDTQPDFLEYVDNDYWLLVNVNDGPIVFDVNGYTLYIDQDVPKEERTITVPSNQTSYLYAALGTSSTPVLGWSRTYGEEDAVYFGEVESGSLGIRRALLYRIKRRYETPWIKLAIDPSHAQEEDPQDAEFPWKSETTVYHLLGSIPASISILAAKPGTSESPREVFTSCMDNFVIGMSRTKIVLSANTLKDHLFYTMEGNTIRKWDRGRFKLRMSF